MVDDQFIQIGFTAEIMRLWHKPFDRDRLDQRRGVISARNTLHEYNNKDLSRLRQLSPGMRVN